MYFAVYLIEAKEYVIVPKNWIENMDGELWIRIVNYGIKRNKKYLCFFSTCENAFENDQRKPNSAFAPNFDAPRAYRVLCDNGTFECRLVMYSRDFEKVRKFCASVCEPNSWLNVRRSIENCGTANSIDNINPNSSACQGETSTAQPVELLHTQNADVDTANGSLLNGQDDGGQHGTHTTQIIGTPRTENMVADASNNPAAGGDQNETGDIQPNEIEMVNVKIEGELHRLELYEPSPDVIDAIDHMFEEDYDSDEEPDLILVEQCSSAPDRCIPMACTMDFLMKRENDIVSGDLAFIERKSGHRQYKCGNKIIKLQKKAVDKFKEWNMCPLKKSDAHFDMRITRILMFLCVKKGGFEVGQKENVFEFIKEFIRVRSGNDKTRMDAIEKNMADAMETKLANELKKK